MKPRFRKNFTSVNDIDREIALDIFERARYFLGLVNQPETNSPSIHELLRGKVMASIFTQPSVRTRTGFQTAFFKLGGSIVQTPDIENSIIERESREKIEDIISYLSTYVDLVLLRTGEIEIANLFLQHARCPIINAGWANLEHPTTALAHAFSILENTGRLCDHKVLMMSNYQSRTFNSLVKLFRIFGTTDITIYSEEDPTECRKSLQTISFFDAKDASFEKICNPETTIIVVDESERRHCSKRFVGQSKLGLEFVKKQQKLEQLIHLKPVVDLLSPELKLDLHDGFIHQSAISMHMKSAIFSWLLEDI